MAAQYFDVVVLGMRLSSLACAALLARRDFRVLVLGHGARPSTYRYDGIPLRRRTFAHLAAPSPAYRRVVAELAQSQAFRRRLRPLDPMLQVLDARRRLDLPPDSALFARELDREFPSARPTIEELYGALARINARTDEVFEQDAVWPPGTFWERRETSRLRDMLPLTASEPRDRRTGDLTIDAGYRSIVDITARFATDVADTSGTLPPFLLARLHGAWSRGVHELPGDEDELTASFVERIRAHGGDVRPSEHCQAIVHKRGKVSAVMLDGYDEPIGCAFVIGDRPSPRLLDLVRELEPPGEDDRGHTVVRRRFVVSLVVRNELVPDPLARHAFLVPRRSGPEVHLHRATFVQSALGEGKTDPALEALGAELWVCEALLDDAWLQGDLRAREAVLATVRDHFPYLDRHTLVLDSAHDGQPLIDLRDGTRRSVARNVLRATGGQVEAEIADPQFRLEPDAYAGLAGEPIRTAVANLLTISPAVMPTLGAEGELLAAWSAARLVTRTDRRKEKMRKEMWSKIEI